MWIGDEACDVGWEGELEDGTTLQQDTHWISPETISYYQPGLSGVQPVQQIWHTYLYDYGMWPQWWRTPYHVTGNNHHAYSLHKMYEAPNQLMTNKGKRKYKVRVLDIAPLRESSPQRSGVLKKSHSITCTFIHNRNEPHLPLPSQL